MTTTSLTSTASFRVVASYANVAPANIPPRHADTKVRVVIMSDTHSKHDCWPASSLPAGDLFIHAGDFTRNGNIKELRRFTTWIESLNYAYKVVIAGNHELTLDRGMVPAVNTWYPRHSNVEECRKLLVDNRRFVYLEDSGVYLDSLGLYIYGSPYQPEFCNWAFGLPRGSVEIGEKWSAIPACTDILVTHGPPHGNIGGVCGDGYDAGCELLTKAVVDRKSIALHCFGHIHEGYGVHSATQSTTTFVNASTCSRSYDPVQPPVIVDLA